MSRLATSIPRRWLPQHLPSRQVSHRRPILRTLTTERPPYVPPYVKPQSPPSVYIPPSPTFSSSGDPSLSHPMPTSMPREDYAEPLAYTTSLIGRVLKYLLLGIVGVSGATLIGLEGGHQYIEHVILKSPPSPSTSDAAYAWELEADSWTGPLATGGTSPLLGWWIRHLLRSAWVCQELGTGNAPGSIGREVGMDNVSVKGMISTKSKSITGGGGFVNRVDKGYQMAESYISEALRLAEQKKLVVLPPQLSVTREVVPITSNIGMRELSEEERVGVELLLRHADVLERMGTRGNLRRSQEIYERVLRFTLSTEEEGSTLKTAPEMNKAKILKFAKKIGDINARLGEGERAEAWWKWGLKGCAIEIGEIGSPLQILQGSSSPAGKSGWFSGWSGSSTPTESMRQTLATNTIPSHQQIPILPALPPPTFRALISLISSYSAYLAQTGDLHSAEAYEQAELGSLRLSAGGQQEDTSAGARLQSLWTKQRAALAELHLAEIRYARVSDLHEGLKSLSQAIQETEGTIAELTGSPKVKTTEVLLYPYDVSPVTALALSASFNGATRRSWLTKPAQSLLKDSQRSAAQGWYLSGVLYERTARRGRLSSSPSLGRNKTEKRFLSATEQGKPVSATEEKRDLEELALDCYDRAVQWHRVAMGGQPGEDEDNQPPSAYNMDPESGGERALYWSAFARIRQRLEDEVAADVRKL